jgi:hypothetical protein
MHFLKSLIFIGFVSISFSVSAAMLESEVVQGMHKICIYSDGSAITISSAGLCPLTK